MKRNLYFLLLGFYFLACSKSETKPAVIPQQVNSLSVYSGNERVRLTFSFSDADIAYFKVFWDDKTISKRIDKSEAVNDLVTTYIDNLNEGVHNFSVISYTATGVASSTVKIQGQVFGHNYIVSLNNRVINDLVFIQGDTAYIEWKEPQENEVAVDIDYINASGVKQHVRLINGTSKAVLPGYKQHSEIVYQTLFLPGKNCIDTFFATKGRIPFISFYASHTVKAIVERSGLVGSLTDQSAVDIHKNVELSTLQFENGSGSPFSLFVIKADLSKGDLGISTLMPNNATAFGLQTVKTMAMHRNAAGDKVLVAVNADYFDWSPVAGRPWGPVVVEGTVVKNYVKEGILGTSYFGIKKDGTMDINLVSELTTADYNSFNNLVGAGANILYLNGAPRVYNDVTRAPRTMIGYTTDKMVYLVVVDGRQSGYSVGMTIDELVAAVGSLGAYAATNLDGGGSSTMVVKKGNGELEIVNRYSDASPRAVANAIAITYN